MAVNDDLIEDDFAALYKRMDENPMSNAELAKEMAKIMGKHIRTAEVPANSVVVSVTGQAVGATNLTGIKVT
jgi:hypothetical protein